MKPWKKIAILLGVLILGIPTALVSIFIYAFGNVCQNEIYSETQSPDGKHKVMVFQRACGATTGFSTQVSIVASTDTLKNEGGNIYVIKGHPKDVALQIIWISDTELRIGKSLSGSEYKAESTWGSPEKIRVTYDAGGS